MTRIKWDVVGERLYEIGVDRGVLYIDTQPGVPWSGLVSVSESPSGGEAKPYYFDGAKYLNLSAAEEFEATINAFYRPAEFGPCEGNVSIQNGLSVTGQPRKSFSFSYRTLIGNDTQRTNYGYKIHLIYNALTSPSQRSANTLGDSSSPSMFSWTITTKPPVITGYKPTAHLVIDSTKTESDMLSDIEDILYGSEADSPRMPTPDELIDIFNGE